MTASDLHFVAILACPLFTLAMLRRGQRPAKEVHIWALLPAGAVMLVGSMRHACDAGQPLAQWLVPALCLLATAAVDGIPRRWFTMAVLAGMGVGLTDAYHDLAHGQHWTGNVSRPMWRTIARLESESVVQDLQRLANETPDLDHEYPPGPLKQIPFWDQLRAKTREMKSVRWECRPARFSRVTRLWHKQAIPQEIWWIGGTPSQPQIRFVDRMPATQPAE